MTNNNKAWEEDSIKVDDADGNLAFEVIDLIKPEKLVPTYVKGAEYSDWRKELEENWTNVTTGNKVGQTFIHVPSGTTVSTGGALGGVESIPSTISIDGDSVSAPDITQHNLQGYAKPMGSEILRKKKKDDTNKRLSASQKIAQKANADVMMNARVPPIPDEPLPPGTKWELIPASYGGIVDGQWDPKYMVAPPSWTQVNIEDPDNRYKATPDGVTPKDPEPVTPKVKNYNLDDNDRFDQLADKVGVSVSKDMFDYYMDKFVDNPTDQSINMNRIFKPHLNTIKSYLPRIEQEIKLGLINGDSIDKIQKDVNNLWDGVISPKMPADLRNSLGNGSQPDVKQYLKTGNWQINKSFVFTEPNDFQGRDLGPGGVLNFAPSWYARAKSIQKNWKSRGDLRPYVNVPMKYNVTIPGSKTSTTPISKSKRSSISLDEPIVRGKSKTKKSNWRSELNGN